MLILGLILLFGAIIITSIRRREKERIAADNLIRIAEETNALLLQSKSALEAQVEEMESAGRKASVEYQSKISSLQQSYIQLFKGQFSTIADLCRTYLRTKRNGENFSKDQIYRKVKDILEYISDDMNLHAQFEAQIDKRLDNIISHLKADLGEMSQLDERFLCYTIVGFDSRTIATLLGLSLANVYTKKSRLKDRIYELDSPYKEFYVRVI